MLNQKKLFEFLESKKALVACVLISGLLTLLWSASKPAEATAEAPKSLDTFIPAGFVLVPIEVQNYEALDSILGPHGFVDLFIPHPDGKSKGLKVATRVRILRAPNNPSQFAVLVRDTESERLVRTETPFFVVIQNAKQRGGGLIDEAKPLAKKSSRIISEVE